MKNKLILLLGICVFVTNFNVFGQKQILSDSLSNYVVIGAFTVEDHSKVWIKKAKEFKMAAISAFNPTRKLHYVYVLRTDDRPKAFEEADRIRKDTPFWDTWVYGGRYGVTGAGADMNPTTGEPMTNVPGRDKNGNPDPNTSLTASNSGSSASSGVPSLPLSESAKKDSVTAVANPTIDNNTGTAAPGAKVFLFKIEAAEAKNALIGKVDVIDLDRAKKTGTYAGNKPVMVNPPGKSGEMSMLCQVFGYRRYHRVLNFFHPSDSGGVVIDSALITVPFELQRLQKGDFAVMYNVYFFKDAAVMRPESKYEVNSLVDMMKENPKYKIRIHGHTNGNASGKVTSMGESTNFFSLKGTKEGFGSAKKLSEERAEMMRQYLIDQGINEHRMEIKAWGGKKPVYDKDSAQAQANVRVEIEILEDK